MRAVVRHFILFAPLLAGASTQEPVPLPDRIDVEVTRIPGFRQDLAAPPCEDGEYLRRVMLDLVGYPPTAEETLAFIADGTPDKRAAVVDRLLTTERFGDFWARRWMGVFFGNPRAPREGLFGRLETEERDRILDRFHHWLSGRLRRDWAWTDTVQDLLIADGVPDASPALAYKLALDGWPRAPYFEGRAFSHFMGIDLSCTGCHDHPFDRWSVEDGISLSAFSNGRRIEQGAKGIEVREGPEPAQRPIPGDKGTLLRPREGRNGTLEWMPGGVNDVFPPVFPKLGKPAKDEILARAFARLMVSRENAQFRVAFVNRIWAWLLGRGIVSPVDEFNLRNKPLSPGLLGLLASAFSDNGHSLRFLIRTICATQTYQRKSEAAPAFAKVTFSRAVIRPLCPEQVLHSLEVATLGRPWFEEDRVQELAERMSRSPLQAFPTSQGVPDVRGLAWLADSDEVWSMIRSGAVVNALAVLPDDPKVRVKAMFLAAFSRHPSDLEMNRYASFMAGKGADGLRDAYWTLLNSPEFLTRH
jgi:hypothetical protein